MTTEEKKKVAETLGEKSAFIRVGWLPIRIRPLTLHQIFEMGALANDIDMKGLESLKQFNILQQMMEHSNDAEIITKIAVVCLFRKRWKRWLFGRYVRKRIQLEHWAKITSFIATTFDGNFFLTSIIFLSRAKTLTEPQTTVRGHSSEE